MKERDAVEQERKTEARNCLKTKKRRALEKGEGATGKQTRSDLGLHHCNCRLLKILESRKLLGTSQGWEPTTCENGRFPKKKDITSKDTQEDRPVASATRAVAYVSAERSRRLRLVF